MHQPSVDIVATNDCSLANPVINLPQISFSEVSQLCPADLPNSTCGTGTLPGYAGIHLSSSGNFT